MHLVLFLALVCGQENFFTPHTATIEVRLPAGDLLYVDCYLSYQDGPVRIFQTERLQPGKIYSYTFYVLAGAGCHGCVFMKTVEFQAGDHVVVDFSYVRRLPARVTEPRPRGRSC